MHAAAVQRPYPSSLNHTPRPSEPLLCKTWCCSRPPHLHGAPSTPSPDPRQPQTRSSPPRMSPAVTGSAHAVPSLSSSALPPGPLTAAGGGSGGGGKWSLSSASTTASTTVRERTTMASAGIDNVALSLSRRHSWASFHCGPASDLAASLLPAVSMLASPSGRTSPPAAAGVAAADGHREADAKPASTSPPRKLADTGVPRPGATFDMAYFLRNTGPPPTPSLGKTTAAPPASALGQRRRSGAKRILSNGLFKRRKDTTHNMSSSRISSVEAFIPSDRVVQKISRDGKKYLQIVARDHMQVASDTSVSLVMSQGSNASQASVRSIGPTSVDGTEAFHDLIAAMDVNNPRYDNIRPKDFMSQSGYYGQYEKPTKPTKSVKLPRLPQVDSGFGLSMTDEFSNRKASKIEHTNPLGSNPPSLPMTPPPLRSISIETEHSTTSTPANYEPSKRAVPEGVSSKGEHTCKSAGAVHVYPQSHDRLAGQGMRRPLKEEEESFSTIRLVPRNAESTQPAVEKPSGDNVAIVIEPGDPRATSAYSARKKREQKARARKIRELQEHHQKLQPRGRPRSRPLIELPIPVGEEPKILESSVDIKEVPSEEALQQWSVVHNVSARTSNDDGGYSPNSADISASPIMFVAEQKSVPRGRQMKKPAKLVLKERRATKSVAIAVRAESPTYSPGQPTATTQISASPQLEPAQSSRSPSSTQPKTRPDEAHHPRRLPAVPRRATSSRDAAMKHLPGAILGAHFPAPPQAVTATALPHKRASVCSSHTSASKEARLEARLEALERENRLLEAALMAVLKTSGTLNRCPCTLLSKTMDAQSPSSAPPLVAAKDAHAAVVRPTAAAQQQPSERRGSADSQESQASTVSALDIYFGTRMNGAAAQGPPASA